jgi:biopolymer transport protein ExbD
VKLEHAVPRKRARVEMIPLIDCVFILLVFFVYSMLAMTLQRGIAVQLPSARTVETDRRAAVVITITADGDLMIDDRPIGFDDLASAIAGERAAEEPPPFVINADASARHGWFVRVMDELRAQGVIEVTVLSNEDEGT